MEEKPKVGRPKEGLETLPNEWYIDVLELYKEGGNDQDVRFLIRKWRGSISNSLWYRWMNISSFRDVIVEGRKIRGNKVIIPCDEKKDRLKKRKSNRDHKAEYAKNSIPMSQRSMLHYHIKKAGGSKSDNTFSLFGYSPKELVENLKSKLEEGMTMDNYGEWHVDHIKPLSLFDLSKESEIKKAWSLDNLQPLWAFDNMSKGNKYIE